MAVPEELGGPGMSLAQICQEQRCLAYYAVPTALATNLTLPVLNFSQHSCTFPAHTP